MPLSNSLSLISGGSRIFPRGGANSQKCYYFSIFCRKLHENERIWTPRGGARPWRPPLDPPMLISVNKALFNVECQLQLWVGSKDSWSPTTSSPGLIDKTTQNLITVQFSIYLFISDISLISNTVCWFAVFKGLMLPAPYS